MTGKKVFAIALALAPLLAPLAGCGNGDDDDDNGSSVGPSAGSYVVVQFRRDFLGVASEAPLSATDPPQNGAAIAVGGKLLRINKEWVVIESVGRELWVPRSVVLFLDVQKSAPAQPGT